MVLYLFYLVYEVGSVMGGGAKETVCKLVKNRWLNFDSTFCCTIKMTWDKCCKKGK